MIHYEVATAQSFWKSRDALGSTQQAAVADAIEKLQRGVDVRVHKLESMPFVAFSVNRDALRVVCHREDDLLVLLHVGPHDAAYDWGKRHRVVQVGSFVRLIRLTVEDEAATAHVDVAPERAPEIPALPGPLSAVTDAAFERLDIAGPTADVLRGLPDEDVLLDVLSHFPVPRADGVLGLASGDADPEALEQAYRAALVAKAPAPTFDAAIRGDQNAAEFWIPHPEDEDYLRALRGDFDAWRVFLHPSQRAVVRVNAKGAAKVTGGPGTGKTIVALHRAKHLAQQAQGSDRVLLTTFSNVLTEQLSDGVDQLCGAVGPLRDRVVVDSLVRQAQAVLRGVGAPATLVTDDADCWARALTHDATGRGQAFYASEREHVLAVHGAWTEAQYLRVRRTGRGTALDRAGRREVWQVLAAYEAALLAAGGGDVIALCHRATEALTSGRATSPYVAVLCDEIQDVGASELRFLAALATDPATGALRPNGLTLCGDGNQRIYRVPFTLRACGIDVRGRASRVLHLNYRTTEAIRRHAVATLAGTADELEDEGVDPLRGYRSLRRGTPPEERSFATPEAEAAWIAELAAADPSRLLVLARKRGWLADLRGHLRARGLEPRLLESGDKPSPEDRLILCTLHRSKGLEAPRVVLAGRQLVPARFPGGGDPADRELWDRKERCLLYVGLTRARDWCGVSTVG
ncbi:MAG: hypothetical protein EP329_18390 [Deltaproteobacteria bacterium]|nr:MAG: hypothetical protein EP329_18390 [Deltaproteobacteria bacterium]